MKTGIRELKDIDFIGIGCSIVFVVFIICQLFIKLKICTPIYVILILVSAGFQINQSIKKSKLLKKRKIEELKRKKENYMLSQNRHKHQYKEYLDFDGFGIRAYFKVEYDEWELVLCFPGPDARYNWKYFHIHKSEIENYIDAYRTNWEEYIRLIKEVNLDGAYSVPGKKSMTINVRGYFDGICIMDSKLPINTQEKLDLVIERFRYCKSKAEELLHWFDEHNLKKQ